MLIKRARIISILAVILMMILPFMPAAGSASALQQGVQISHHPLTGMVNFMGAPSTGRAIHAATGLAKNATAEDAARAFLAVQGGGFGIVDAKNNLKVLRETRADNGNNTVRFQQTYKGIPVLAGEMIVHMDSGKNVLSAMGEILPGIDLDTNPLIDEAAAVQSALAVTARENGVSVDALQASTPELWIYNPALLTPYAGQTVLGWRMEVTPKTELLPVRQLVLVEAKRGGIALSFNQIDYAKNRLTYNANTTTTLPGTLVCNESNPNCTGGSADAINAHVFAGQTYDAYVNNHGRDSIDGAGMALISTVNYGVNYQNAFWNGTQMVYGAGFSSADDVVAHELTHGVTEYESNLFYYYQSGAINESFSDVWGEFVDLSNGMGTDTAASRWQMGEDLTAFGVIRDMEDPTIFGDPDKMTSVNYSFDTGYVDNGGVHSNSGINNKAVFLMVDGGTFNGRTVTGLGIVKVARIYYFAQTNLLNSGSDYLDLYNALQSACAALSGTSGITTADCQEVLDAINAVEMNLQPVAGFNTEMAVCDVPGQFPVNSFYDNLEIGVGNWLGGAIAGTSRWTYDSPYGAFAHSGDHFLYGDDFPSVASDSYVRMANSVTVPPNGKLLFHHAYHFENGFDGGVLEYSTNGGGAWTDAGALIEGNGYDGVLSGSFGNPLGARQAFTGPSHGYISTRVNLSSLAGQNVMFRFRMGVDDFLYYWGWWVDDVQIYQCADSDSPNPFSKSTPLNAATALSTSPTLTWATSTGATSYDYCYDTTNDNACSAWIDNGTSTSKTLTGLSTSTTYYWHVRANNAIATTYSNDFPAAFWSFTTVPSAPGVFNKSTPLNASTNISTSPTLAWTASAGATSYEVCYDTTNDSACSTWIDNGTSTSKALSGLSGSTTYYWHVRANNVTGTTYSNGSTAVFWSFTTSSIVSGVGDTTGVFRPSNGLLYLKNQNTSGFADIAINYGLAGDYPVAGDWDGNGTETIGIYRNGSFYLRNSNTLGFADLVIAFGLPGDQPVVGDWNADGIDSIGIYRPSTGQFQLRNLNTSGPADMIFYLGNVGDVGIAGDWNGDGSDTTGVFRPSNGVIFLKNANTTGFADVALNYGLAGDLPVTGDWNNDGIDTIGVYRNAQFYLRNSNTIGFADIVFALGNPGDMPIAGNWDGLP